MKNSSEDSPLEIDNILNINQSSKVYKQTIPVNVYHFYLVNEIESPSNYIELLNTLKFAEPHDTILIYINCSGGDLYTTIQIIGAINKCRGTVITSLDGAAFSAASMIFLSGHAHLVTPHSSLMIHNYSGFLNGKGHEMSSQIKFTEKFFESFIKEIYGKFLNEAEIKDVLDGKDIWLNSEEVSRRLKNKLVKEKNNSKLKKQSKN